MSQQFDFFPRPNCICGAQLDGGAATTIRKIFSRGEIVFRRCPTCGSYIQSPCLTTASLAAWYDSPEYRGDDNMRGIGYLNYARGEHQRRVEAASRFRRDLAPFLPASSRVLEIGAASGALLAEVREHGHLVIGCDLSAAFAEAAGRNYGLSIEVCDWLELDIPDGTLDAVVMLGTASNLADLDASLLRIRRKLKPDGFLVFNFPAADSWLAKLYGKRMWMFTPSAMQFVTRKGMGLALESAGMQVEWRGVDRQSPTLAKLIGHARLGYMYGIVNRFGLTEAALPFAVPLPGIVAVRARPRIGRECLGTTTP